MKMDHIIEGCPGVLCIHDNLFVYDEAEKECDLQLMNLMKIPSDNGLIFNSRKCHNKHPQITFYTTIFNKEGMKPNPEKNKRNHRNPPPQMCSNYSNYNF